MTNKWLISYARKGWKIYPVSTTGVSPPGGLYEFSPPPLYFYILLLVITIIRMYCYYYHYHHHLHHHHHHHNHYHFRYRYRYNYHYRDHDHYYYDNCWLKISVLRVFYEIYRKGSGVGVGVVLVVLVEVVVVVVVVVMFQVSSSLLRQTNGLLGRVWGSCTMSLRTFNSSSQSLASTIKYH